MIWHGDPTTQGIVAQDRWNREFEAAANRRLLEACGQRGILEELARRTQLVLEHLYYKVTGSRFSPPEPEVEEVAISDAELIRLLSLLAPDGQVLHVERIRRTAVPSDDGDQSTVLTRCRG